MKKEHYLKIICIQNGPVEGNAYIVWDIAHPEAGLYCMLDINKIAILIDPGEEPKKICQEIKSHNVTISIFHNHITSFILN